jgi:hypothetical protein
MRPVVVAVLALAAVLLVVVSFTAGQPFGLGDGDLLRIAVLLLAIAVIVAGT